MCSVDDDMFFRLVSADGLVSMECGSGFGAVFLYGVLRGLRPFGLGDCAPFRARGLRSARAGFGDFAPYLRDLRWW